MDFWIRCTGYVVLIVCKYHFAHISHTKTFPVLDASTIWHLETLGVICSSIDRPPPSIVISEGLKLERSDTTAAATGGLMEVWFGEHDLERVVIKVFRTYPDANMTKAKKVRV